MVKSMHLYVHTTDQAKQPIGIFSTKFIAAKNALEKNLWGEVSLFKLDLPSLDHVLEAGRSVGKNADIGDPTFIGSFSSGYLQVLKIEWVGNEIVVTDRQLQKQFSKTEYLERYCQVVDQS